MNLKKYIDSSKNYYSVQEILSSFSSSHNSINLSVLPYNPNSKNESYAPIIYLSEIKKNIKNMKMTAESKYYLNKSMSGMSFVGVGDLATGLIHIHPVQHNNVGRSRPVDNEDQLRSFDESQYLDTSLSNKNIVHNPCNTSHGQLKKLILSSKYSSSQEFMKDSSGFLRGKIEDSRGNWQNRFFGFAIFDNSENIFKVNIEGKKYNKHSFRFRSRTLNMLGLFSRIPVNIKDNSGKYINLYLNDNPTMDEVLNGIWNGHSNNNPNGYLPLDISHDISKIVSSQISNINLKRSLIQFENSDLYENIK